jgi:hypothetical protein
MIECDVAIVGADLQAWSWECPDYFQQTKPIDAGSKNIFHDVLEFIGRKK